MALAQHSEFYSHFVSRNQLRLIDFCDDCVALLKKDIRNLNTQMLLALHYHSMVILIDSAGEFRKNEVHISYSIHTPPPHSEVKQIIFNCLENIRENWDKASTFSLMAYALWRINWIHPFDDGNGRTARALTYIIHNVKFGKSPTNDTLPRLIELSEDDYQKTLRNTDETYGKEDIFDVKRLQGMSKFLFTILINNARQELENQ
jgi:Fic family protein